MAKRSEFGGHWFDVTVEGAIGDGRTVDTDAFQSAVDSCAAAGGGTVYVPPGEYVLGRVILASNVTLHLASGAILRPSRSVVDYPPVQGSPRSAYQPDRVKDALTCRYAIFYAFGAKNVTIEGRGTICGDGAAFWTVKNTGDFTPWNCVAPWHYFTPNQFRPVLIILEDCEDAVVRDISLDDASVYAAWFAGCRSLRCDGVRIANNLAGPNTDGFHFSSCRDVRISGCSFVCGDDCIAIDSNHDGPSVGFCVDNCTFDTTVNVFRIFTGLDPNISLDIPRGLVRDITATNCTVMNASGVFNVTAEGGDIRNLTFSSFTINMDLRGSVFFLHSRNEGTIRGVTITAMQISTDGVGSIVANDGEISDITLDGLSYEVTPRTKKWGNDFPDPLLSWGDHHFAPYFLLVRRANGVTIRNASIRWRAGDLSDLDKVPDSSNRWSAIECDDVRDLVIQGVMCSPHNADQDTPALRLTSVRNAFITGCSAGDGTVTFLSIDGDTSGVRLVGNDLVRADRPVFVADDTPSGAVQELNNATSSH